ncbi:hypothetical protein [Bacillus mycoides]|nr:hypothetical protein [Bacillus mycoides]
MNRMKREEKKKRKGMMVKKEELELFMIIKVMMGMYMMKKRLN